MVLKERDEFKRFETNTLLTGRTQIDASLAITEGEGIDITTTGNLSEISGEDASDTNKGIATFDENDFTVTSGDVALKNKTSYLSIPGCDFTSYNPASDNLSISSGDDGSAYVGTGALYLMSGINLPHGATVTGVIVYGGWGAVGVQYDLYRVNHSGTTGTMATANIGTEDTTISLATIDNENYIYFIQTKGIPTGGAIWGVRITYTTDYD